MKFTRIVYEISLLMLSIFYLTSCSAPEVGLDNFHLQYRSYGGFSGGIQTQIDIYDNHDLLYKNYSYSIKAKISDDMLQQIINALNDNNFLSLKNEYLDNSCCDDIYSAITYVSESDSHRVVTSWSTRQNTIALWETRIDNIMRSINNAVESLDMDIDTAIVSLNRSVGVFRWPFDNFKLHSNIGLGITANSDILEYVSNKEEISDMSYCAIFLEDSIYYFVSASDDTALNVGYSTTGTRWPFSPYLSDIDEDGVLIYGNDFFWLNDTLSNLDYPEIFYDTKLGDNLYVYWVSLKQGNYFPDLVY